MLNRPHASLLRRRRSRARQSSSTCWRRWRSTPPTAIARRPAGVSSPGLASPCRSGPGRRPASSGRCARAAAAISRPSPAIRDWPPLRQPLRDFIDWVARWTLGPRGMVLRMAIRANEIVEQPPPKFGVVATGKPPARMTEARQRVLAALEGGEAPPSKVDARRARPMFGRGRSKASSRTARSRASRWRRSRIAPALDPEFSPSRLNADQRPAADDLIARVAERAFSATLLEGVTGSGKTEVYFEAIAEVLRQGRQALVLLPEIALTAQFLDRFAARFGARPAEWHSGLTEPPARTRLGRGGERRGAGRRRRALGAFPAFRRSRPDRRRRGARGRLQAGGRRHLQRARHGGRARAAGESADRARLRDARAGDAVQRRNGPLSLAASCPRASATASMPDIATVDLRREGPPRGRWLSPRAIAGVEAALGAGRTGALVPQPARLRAADAVPRLRASVSMSQLRLLAGRAPLPRRARLPSLRPCRGTAEALPRVPGGRQPDRLRSGRRAPGGGGGDSVPRHPHAGAVVRLSRRDRDPARPARRRGARRLRSHHRHATRRQGPQFPSADLRLRGRRRCRARQRRPARRRAHVPASASGDGAGRARRGGRAGAVADLAARASGHRRARLGRRGTVLPRRDRAAAPRRPAAVRTSRRDHRLGRGSRRGGSITPARSPAPLTLCRRAKAGASRRSAASPTTARSRCSAPPRRRSRCCASATASGSPPRRRDRPTCRVSCARCWPPRRRRAAGSGSRSTSIRKAFCEGKPSASADSALRGCSAAA